MNTVLSQSKARLLQMRPLVGIPSRGQLRNTTSFLWKRRFSSKMAIYQKLKAAPNKRSSSTRHARNIVNHVTQNDKKISLKWAVLTGVTIFIGTIIYTSRHNFNITIDIQDSEEKDVVSSNSRRNKNIKIFNNNWLFFCYSTLPLNAVSRLWGQFNNLTLPMWFRPIGYKFYTFLFNVNLDEIEDPDLYHYANLGEFFYRRIKPETRPIAPGEDVIVSPSDGQVLQAGVIDSETGEIQQVKGLTYSIKEFLGTHEHPSMVRSESSLNLLANETEHEKFAKKNKFDLFINGSNNGSRTDIYNISLKEDGNVTSIKAEGDKSLAKFDTSSSKTLKLINELSTNIPYYNLYSNVEPKNTDLYFAVIYLSPGDYHHYHSPVDWVCKKRRYFPGELFSVSPYFQRNFPNLFVLNERVALLGYWKHGFFSMTPVGATNVGSIKLSFDQELVTNIKRAKNVDPHICYEATYLNASKILGGMPLTKGEEMGGFELGSTVVLCFEAPKNFKFNVNVGDKIKMGEKLGSLDGN
ncbi:phosphatidylserine decarboxylase 1 PWA37_003300 [Arxiozyma heterogenica]|uniref:phosphatidylserine decarboxylase 1 n=1 Tax=Arxiozyma heterogenica TaxID=278026 RepID=UPI002EF11DDF